MRKPLRINESASRKTVAGAAAISLTLALAALGCSSGKMAEERRPVAPTVTPAATNPIPIAAQNGNVPMISSGPASQLDPAVDAQAALAARENRGGRVLGTSDPGPNPLAGAVLPATGQFIQPAAAVTPPAATPMTPAVPVFVAGPYDNGTAVVVNGVNLASDTAGAAVLTPTIAVSPVAGGAAITSSVAATPGVGIPSSVAPPPTVVSGATAPLTAMSAAAPPITAMTAANRPITAMAASNPPLTALTAANPPLTAMTAATTSTPAIGVVRMAVPTAGAASTSGTATAAATIGAVSPVTAQANARVRAAGASASAAPQSAARGPAVRITSSSDGTPLVTNVTAQQRQSLTQRIRRFFSGSSVTGQTTPKP